jgi:hypothetical protein
MTVTLDDFLAWLREAPPYRSFKQTRAWCALVAYFDERCDQKHYLAWSETVELIHVNRAVCYRLTDHELDVYAHVSATLGDRSGYTASELLVALRAATTDEATDGGRDDGHSR